MLFYNPDLLAEAGVEMPDQLTWTEYAEMAKKLTAGEGPDKQWGGYWVDWHTQFMATQQGEIGRASCRERVLRLV